MYAKLCLFGAGGHGRVVAAQIKARHPSINLSFGDTGRPVGSLVNGIRVITDTPEYLEGTDLIVTIGNNAVRQRVQVTAVHGGVSLSHFIADPEHYFTALPGPGTMVLAGAIVTADAAIGTGVIVNSGAIVEHDCVIGDFCHLAPGSVLAGGVHLGARVFVGAGARIVNQAQIAADAVIGAGATVVGNITRPGTYIGTPARRLGP